MLTHITQLSPGDIIYVLDDLLSAPVKLLLAARPKLAPWIPDLEQTRDNLAVASGEPQATAPAGDPKEGFKLDRRAEAAVKALALAYQLGAQLAIAKDEDPAPWNALLAYVFPNAQKFLRATWPEQVGETVRTVGLAASAEVPSFKVHGQSHANLLALITTNNKALSDFIKPRLEAPAQTPESVISQTKRSARLLRDFFRVADRDLPLSDDPTSARYRVFSAILERLAAKNPPDPTNTPPGAGNTP